MADICVYAKYVDAAGDGVDGIIVTWNCDRITRATGAVTALLTGAANNIAFGRDGMYGYHLAGADLITYDYIFNAITASALPTGHELAALWTLWSLSWHDVLTAAMTATGSIGNLIVTNLNVAVGSVCSCVVSALLRVPAIKNALVSAELTMYRGDTWNQRISGLGDLTAATEIWFGMKEDKKDDTDAQSIVLISLTNGLEVIVGTQGTAANGSITIVAPPTAGIIDVMLEGVETAKIDASKRYAWDAQKLIGDDPITPRCGTITIAADVVRATS
jgi:hypothetical protein